MPIDNIDKGNDAPAYSGSNNILIIVSEKKIIIKADRLLAKVLQHEIDHLNGILIEDKFVKQKQ